MCRYTPGFTARTSTPFTDTFECTSYISWYICHNWLIYIYIGIYLFLLIHIWIYLIHIKHICYFVSFLYNKYLNRYQYSQIRSSRHILKSVCLKLFLLTVCWKFELLGSQEMIADVEVMFVAWNKKHNSAGFLTYCNWSYVCQCLMNVCI